MRNRDVTTLMKIVQHAGEIQDTITRFELDLDKFKNDFIVKNAISMCVLQIGELSSRLTENFKERYDGVPWRKIKDMRNLVAHNYRIMNLELLWEAISIHVVYLCEYCEKIIDIEEGSKND